MDAEINMNEIESLVYDGEFTDWLVNNTVNLSTAAFVLQTLIDKINELKNS